MSVLGLTLLRPVWLLGLPVLLGLSWWLWTRRGGLGDWDKAADPALMRAMAALGRVDAGAGRTALLSMLGCLGVGCLALAGPAIERRDAPSFRNLDGVLFLVDASDRATGHEGWTDLLAAGRFGIAGLGTRPAGIIVFAGDAYLASDMTHDHLQLGQTLSLIAPGLVPDPGSRPARALRLAAERLRAAEVIAGDVVLMSDGAGLGRESLTAAQALRDLGARLTIVALGLPTPAMEAHAQAVGGTVLRAGEPEALARFLSDRARAQLVRQDYPLLFWQDLGRYVLGLCLLPLLLLFRREGV